MRIGVDATCWSNCRGYGRFTRDLLGTLLNLDSENDYVFFVDSDDGKPLPSRAEVVRLATRMPAARAASADGHRSLRDIWLAAQTISREALDLMFFPSLYTYVPLFSRVPKVVTIHDAIPEMFPELVFPTWRSRVFWGMKAKLGSAQARIVLTVSEYSRRCLSQHLKLPANRVRVIHEASSPAFRPLAHRNGECSLARFGLPNESRFLVYVGGFSPHKNLFLLVDVFQELLRRPEFADLYLLLVGDHQTDVFFSCFGQLTGQVRRAGLENRVRFTGHLDDEDLVVLLNQARLLVLPSFSEGFGLPAVEAAACGTPVVATAESPLPELLGEGAIGVDPRDRAPWFAAISRVLSDAGLRARMSAAGLAAAGRLSWRSSALQLLSIFAEVQHGRVARD